MSLWFWLACTPPDEAPQPQDNHSIAESSTDSATDTSAPDSATDSDWVRQVDVYLEDFLVLETNQPAKVTDCTVQDCTDDDQDGLTDAWGMQWAEVAKRLASKPGLLGLELLNEPWR